jgi:predicted transcriptional regulator
VCRADARCAIFRIGRWIVGDRHDQTLLPEWYHFGMALTLRTDDELERALAALAASEGLSRQEIIRRAVLERYERAGHRERVDASGQRLIERWGDVLDRLGSV